MSAGNRIGGKEVVAMPEISCPDSGGRRFQIVGIGNAMVDVLCHVEDSFLEDHGIHKGIMQIIGMERAVELYGLMHVTEEVSGGSVANTIAGLGKLGCRAAYIGKVLRDHLGKVFATDLRRQGVTFDTPQFESDARFETGRCMILITPDGERSMNTYLGAGEFLSARDIDDAMIASSEWLYLEGFRFDGPNSIEAFNRAAKTSRQNGGKVALALSDPFCVERNRRAFRALLARGIDLLFCNEIELKAMYPSTTFEGSMQQAARQARLVACTRGGKGAVVSNNGYMSAVPASGVKVVDATGAGDQFASGFLFGLISGQDPVAACRLGILAASEVISHVGARPVTDLLQVFSSAGQHRRAD